MFSVAPVAPRLWWHDIYIKYVIMLIVIVVVDYDYCLGIWLLLLYVED